MPPPSISYQGSPQKKEKKNLVDRIISGMSPGRRRTSTTLSLETKCPAAWESDCDDTGDDEEGSQYAESMMSELKRPDTEEELNRLFGMLLADSNLQNDERMWKMNGDAKWRLVQAKARALQETSSCHPSTVIRRLTKASERLAASADEEGIVDLRLLDGKVLDEIRVSFRSASISWLESFAEAGGCQVLANLLRLVLPAHHLGEQHHNRGQAVIHLIEAVHAFANSKFGLDALVWQEGLLPAVIGYLGSGVPRIRQCVIGMLTSIAYMDSGDGAVGRLLEAFTAWRDSEDDDEHGRFLPFTRLLARHSRLAIRHQKPDSLKFIVQSQCDYDQILCFVGRLPDLHQLSAGGPGR
jgi:hypothetical protein